MCKIEVVSVYPQTVQNNGYEASTYEDDYRAHSAYIPTPSSTHHHKVALHLTFMTQEGILVTTELVSF